MLVAYCPLYAGNCPAAYDCGRCSLLIEELEQRRIPEADQTWLCPECMHNLGSWVDQTGKVREGQFLAGGFYQDGECFNLTCPKRGRRFQFSPILQLALRMGTPKKRKKARKWRKEVLRARPPRL